MPGAMTYICYSMQLVPAALVREYKDAMLNIHPGLLPAFGGKGLYGLRVHKAVIASGARFSGATVHFVDEEYDTGPILAQAVVPVNPHDTPQMLAARVLQQVSLKLKPCCCLLTQRCSVHDLHAHSSTVQHRPRISMQSCRGLSLLPDNCSAGTCEPRWHFAAAVCLEVADFWNVLTTHEA